MGIIDLKKELNKLNKDEIIEIISNLYKNDKSAKAYLDFYVNPNEKEMHIKFKTQIFEAFYPKRGYALKLQQGKKAISEFKKLNPDPELIADLMLFYVENGVKYTNDFGDISEAFYSSIESTYKSALKFIEKQNLLNTFAQRAVKIVSDTSGIGWGFHDSLADTCYEFYPDLTF